MKCNKEFLSLNKNDLIVMSNKLWKESIKDYVTNHKDFNKENYHKILEKFKDKMKYRKIHSKITADLCERMLELTKTHFSKDDEFKYWFNILYFSALTHDIKKFNNDHSTAAAIWIKSRLLLKYEFFSEEVCTHICDLIKYHKAKQDDIFEIKYKIPEIKMLIIFIRLADKLSKLVEEGKFDTIQPSESDNKLEALKENSEKIIYDKVFLCNSTYVSEILLKYIIDDFKIYYCNKDIMALI